MAALGVAEDVKVAQHLLHPKRLGPEVHVKNALARLACAVPGLGKQQCHGVEAIINGKVEEEVLVAREALRLEHLRVRAGELAAVVPHLGEGRVGQVNGLNLADKAARNGVAAHVNLEVHPTAHSGRHQQRRQGDSRRQA